VAAFEQAGLGEQFEAKTIAGELLALLHLSQTLSNSRDEKNSDHGKARRGLRMS
jgi:hypothetical protein